MIAYKRDAHVRRKRICFGLYVEYPAVIFHDRFYVPDAYPVHVAELRRLQLPVVDYILAVGGIRYFYIQLAFKNYHLNFDIPAALHFKTCLNRVI